MIVVFSCRMYVYKLFEFLHVLMVVIVGGQLFCIIYHILLSAVHFFQEVSINCDSATYTANVFVYKSSW
jgi:ABC-type phosphate transport system permease subunit